MDISLEFLKLGFLLTFLIWISKEIWDRRSGKQRNLRSISGVVAKECKGFIIVALLFNALISVFYLGYGFYEFWIDRIVTFKSVLSTMTWVLATLVVICSKDRTLRESKRWPWVLMLWWFFSSTFGLVLVFLYLITHLKSINKPHNLPQADIADIGSFPLSVLLCFNALWYGKSYKELEHPLLQKEDEHSSRDNNNNNNNAFSTSGLWSKVTFQWLNPLFKLGRVQKLELPHIPSVPESEKAETASILLEESLRKQKFEDTSLPKAILRSVRISLAINAVFAGIHFLLFRFCKKILMLYFRF